MVEMSEDCIKNYTFLQSNYSNRWIQPN